MHSTIPKGFRQVRNRGFSDCFFSALYLWKQLFGDHLENFQVFAAQTTTTATTVSNRSEWRQPAEFLKGWETSTHIPSTLWVDTFMISDIVEIGYGCPKRVLLYQPSFKNARMTFDANHQQDIHFTCPIQKPGTFTLKLDAGHFTLLVSDTPPAVAWPKKVKALHD